MAIRLQYALNQNNEPVSITNETVQSRSGQVYHCPDPHCTELVIPKKGEVNQHHFSHKSGSSCYGPESSLHLLVKDAFLSMEVFTLPKFYFSPQEYFLYYRKEIEELGKINFSLPKEINDWSYYFSVFLGSMPNLFEARNIDLHQFNFVIEYYHGKIKPDIRIINKKNPEKELLIEIAVTHKIDKKKQIYVENNNLALLEIDLSSFYRKGKLFTKEEVKKIITENPYKANWKNITQTKKLLQLKKSEILAVVENNLKLIEKFYPVFVEEYLKPNIKYLNNEVEVIKTFQKDKANRNEEEEKILNNGYILSLYIKKFKAGSIYISELQKMKKKEEEIKKWRRDFYKDYHYKKL